jgi:hypothetical protein
MNTQRRNAYIAGGIILLALVVYALWQIRGDGSGEWNTDSNTATTTESGVWQTYEHEDFNFSLEYPPNATAEIENGEVKIQFVGPRNQPNTEIQDGFILYIRTEPMEMDLAILAQRLLDEQPDYAETLEPLRMTFEGGEIVYGFTVRSALGPPIDYRVTEAEPATAFVVSHIVQGDDEAQAAHHTTIERILDSLTLTATSTDAAVE